MPVKDPLPETPTRRMSPLARPANAQQDRDLLPDDGAVSGLDDSVHVAYLVNQYPHTSHSFIRREILAIERQGGTVTRFSIRRSVAPVIDAEDVAESRRTQVLMEHKIRMVWAMVRQAVTHPLRFLGALQSTIAMGRTSHRGVVRHFAYLAQACLLVEWCRAREIPHVHAHFGTNPAAVALLSRELGGPGYSFTVHGPEEFDRPLQLSLDRKIEGATMVAAISEFTRSQLYRWSSAACSAKIHVIRCALDPRYLAEPPTPVPESRRLVCVGRLCEQKGQLRLIVAAASLRDEGLDFELTLIGDGPMRAEIEGLIHTLNLAGVVRLVGWQDGDSVRQEILASRALVLPSFAEGLPVVLMEALALHRPVISTYVAGIPELVTPSVNGWLVAAGCQTSLCEAMREALTATSEKLSAMGSAGARKVRLLHDGDVEAAKLISHFRNASTRVSSPRVQSTCQ